jgi:hemerythrin
MQAAAAFTWTDKFKLGYDPMDETHEEFVQIVNAMLTAPDADLLAHLDAFMAHGEAHFAQELAWMTATAFPSTECHAGEHEAVMKSVREVREHLAAGGDPVSARKLAAALKDWFPGHADYLDSALAQWMVKKQTGGVPIVLRRNLTFEP